MSSVFARRLAGLALWLLLCLATAAWADVAVPVLTARVTDLTGTLNTSQRNKLEGELQAIETRSSSQIAILMVPTTQPESIEQYAIRVVDAWKLGQKGKDNGLLLLVAKNDRKVRIEVGYGLEGVIPDAIARRVIDERITPRFKQGDFAGGLMTGIEQLASLIEGRSTVEKAAEDPGASTLPSLGGEVMDLTGTLTEEQADELGNALRKSGMDRGTPFFVLIVPTTAPDTIAQYAERVLKHWGAHDNLDSARSGILVIAKDSNTAHIELGPSLQAKWAAGASETIVSSIEPRLVNGDYPSAVRDVIAAIGQQIDAVIANRSFSERQSDWAGEMPIVLLIAVVVVVGSALRWMLGPLFGALTTGGLVGTGAWLVTGTIEVALVAAVVSFVFILVGLLNWIAFGLSGSSGGGHGGGFSSGGGGGSFSGGGGSFGGGGASGSW